MAAKQQNKMMAKAIEFIASLIFLYVVFGPLSAAAPSLGNGLGYGIWAPLLYAVAVLGSITLFFSSLVGFAMSSQMLMMSTKKAMMVTPFAILAWVAITGGAGWSMNLWLTLAGFVIGWFGMGAEMMK